MTNPHPDLFALLRGVLVAPDDDAPRLVYADRLDELAGTVPCDRCAGKGTVRFPWVAPCDTCRGTGTVGNGWAERAEFVRVQCELARLEADRGGDGRAWIAHELKQRDTLRSRLEKLWHAPAKGFDSSPYPKAWKFSIGEPIEGCVVPQCRVDRGFIDSITLPGDQLAAVIEAVCPDLTIECWECRGRLVDGGALLTSGVIHANESCGTCHGLGTVTRVLTGGEQPVRVVRLTSLPYAWDLSPYYHAEMVLSDRWPHRRLTLFLPDGTEIPPPTKLRGISGVSGLE